MQNRMRTHQLNKEEIEGLLSRAKVCVLATNGKDGFPYALPVNFVHHEDKIYIHGLARGEKIDNITRDSKVCVEIHEMLEILDKDVANPCDVNVSYNSLVIQGQAKLLTDIEEKKKVLNAVVDKYTPQYSGQVLPENMVKGTGVIEVEVDKCTGKYYK